MASDGKKLADRRAALARQALGPARPRTTGTIGPVSPAQKFLRAGVGLVPTQAINRVGRAINASPAGAVLGGIGDAATNAGGPFFKPKNVAAAAIDIAPVAGIASKATATTARAFSRLGRGKKLAAEGGVNAVPNPFEEKR